MPLIRTLFLGLLLGLSASADEDRKPSDDQPKAVPATRAQMKAALDRLKFRQPRLPLPAPTAEEIERAKQSTATRGLGGGLVNNARMRNHYLPEDLRGPSAPSRDPDPVMTLKSPFVTELFWIASRVNNCHYCLGHQESKLAADGLTDDQIAALDGDWSNQTPARRAAFAFARKLTYEPHRISEADLAALKEHYTELQVLEIVFLVSRYNATNRWTDGMGIPQEEHRVYLTETAPQFRDHQSDVAPLGAKPDAPATAAPRPGLETRAQVEAQLAACRNRQPRLPLLDDAAARDVLPDWPVGDLPPHARLLANFPKTGASAAKALLQLERAGAISPRLRAALAWTAARHDRAWYALAQAGRQLRAQGLSDDQIFAIDTLAGDWTDGERLALKLARKMTVTPQWITDADIVTLRSHYSDSEVAEIVYRITQAAMFDRLTESAGLELDPADSSEAARRSK